MVARKIENVGINDNSFGEEFRMKKKLLLMLFIAVLSIGNVKASRVDKEKSFEDNYKMVELGTIIENKIANYYNIEKRFEDLYPEYYGGMYISDDSKKIILQIVKDNIPNKNNKDYDFYNEITTMDERIIIEYVNNSFNELNDVNNILSEYIIKRVDDKNIVGAYIDVVNNKTIVELSNSNEINKERIKNVVNKNRQSNIKNEKKSQKKSILNFVQSGDNNLYYTVRWDLEQNLVARQAT